MKLRGRVVFNRQIFSEHETDDEHNTIIRLNHNLHVYPMMLYEIAKQHRLENTIFAYFCMIFERFWKLPHVISFYAIKYYGKTYSKDYIINIVQ